jgi:hypothetical protein
MIAAEQIVDGIIRLIQKNTIARTPVISDLHEGERDLFVDDTLRFDGANEIILMDNSGSPMEYNTVLTKVGTNRLVLLNPASRNFIVSDGAVVQKAIGNVPLFEEDVLFGDREVIPNNGVAVTVEPTTLSNEWLYVQGGLGEEHAMTIMCYIRADRHEDAMRVVMKYGQSIYTLLNGNIHLDVVNDTTPILADLSAGSDTVTIGDTSAWPVDNQYRYEVQDNNNAEIDFRLVEVVGPQEVRLNRRLARSYRVADKAKFTRRVAYIYDSRCTQVEWGTVSKSSALYKAAKITWFGKDVEDLSFPQVSKS